MQTQVATLTRMNFRLLGRNCNLKRCDQKPNRKGNKDYTCRSLRIDFQYDSRSPMATSAPEFLGE